jgi:hypothetical protein
MSLLRRIRGIVGSALLWGCAWAGVGLLFGVAVWLLRDPAAFLFPVWRFVALQGLFWGIWGSVSGAVFASLLIVAERNSTISTLSTRRLAGWGALGGFFLPLASYGVLLVTRGPVIGALIPTAIAATIAGLLGAGMAAGHLSLARRAPALPSRPATIADRTA